MIGKHSGRCWGEEGRSNDYFDLSSEVTEFFHLDAATGCVAHEEKMERLNIPEEKGRFAEWVLRQEKTFHIPT